MTPPTSRPDAEKRAEQEAIARDYQESTARERGQADGVVVTPVEIVDFQLRATAEQLRTQYNTDWSDPRVTVTDPFGGTGIYCARLIQTCGLTPDQLDDLFHHRMEVIEIDPTAARIAAINLARVFAEEAGRFPRSSPVRCADTFQEYENDHAHQTRQ